MITDNLSSTTPEKKDMACNKIYIHAHTHIWRRRGRERWMDSYGIGSLGISRLIPNITRQLKECNGP